MAPAIKLYTNHRCPWAHRAHIVLAELGLQYEEEIIDLDTPRTPAYLRVNPRGLVPSLSFDGEVITESAIVAQFLADTYPSTLVPSTADAGGPLTRARIAFFVDAWFSKVNGLYTKSLYAYSVEESETFAKDVVAAIIKEVEPLLANAGPFFGGSEKLTLAEALTGPFVLRLFTFAKHGLLPESLSKSLEQSAPNFHKWGQAVSQHPSVLSIFKEDVIVGTAQKRIAKIRGQA